VGLRLKRAEAERMHAHMREGYPHEVVGILAGSRDTWSVYQVVSLVNERADSPANRYHVSALALYRAEEALAARGLDVVGYYHSHPDHPSAYSDFDRDHALPNMSYLIGAVTPGGVVGQQSWRLRDDRSAMDEEEIILED